MKLFTVTTIIALTISFLPLSCFSAENSTARELIKRSDELMRGKSIAGIYSMEINTPRWKRKLSLQVYSLGREKIFIRILSPAKEAGIATLRIKNEMWNYLPSVERVIKIPPSMMLQPWMGSDFANDDLVKESSIVNDYTHKIISEQDIDGHPVCKIELIPKPNAAVIWGKIIYWVRKDDYIPLREEFYNEKMELIKLLEYSDIGKVSDRIIPRTWKMKSIIKPNHYTIVKLVNVKYNTPIDESIFTLANLKKLQ